MSPEPDISSAPVTHVLRPTPRAGVVLGIVVLAAIALPGFFIAPVEYLSGSGLSVLLVCGAFAYGLVLLDRLRVECVRDDVARTLTITRIRWPVAPLVRSFPLDSIESVDVESRRNAWAVVLVLRDGERFPLTGGKSSSSAHAATAAVLRGWLSPGA